MEILVAVGVLALMGSLMFGVVRTMFRVSEDLDEVVRTSHMGRVALERMSRDLSQAFLSLQQGEEEKTETVFIGERDRVVFAYLGNIAVRAGGVETDQGIVEYKLAGPSEDRPGSNLVRRFKAVIDDDAESGGKEAILAEGVKTVRFQYWDKDGEDWEDSWKAEDWLSTTPPGYRLPSRIKIRLELYDIEENIYEYETQTLVYVSEPILFGQPITQKQKEWLAADQLMKVQKNQAVTEDE